MRGLRGGENRRRQHSNPFFSLSGRGLVRHDLAFSQFYALHESAAARLYIASRRLGSAHGGTTARARVPARPKYETPQRGERMSLPSNQYYRLLIMMTLALTP